MIKKFNIKDYIKDVDDDYIFDRNGNFVKRVERDGPDRLGKVGKDGKTRYYELADQVNDSNIIRTSYERGEIHKLKVIPISIDEIIKAIGERGGMNNPTRQNMWSHMFWNSMGYRNMGRSKFDYTYDYLIPKHKDIMKGEVFDFDTKSPRKTRW